jgi:glycosyltransferase involved in cell wall biosynthesis
MKVLWFTNNSAVGANKVDANEVGCAWIVSLETELTKSSGVQLGIAFTCKQPEISQFAIGNTIYFPITLEPIKNKFKKIFARFTHKIENEDIIQRYLDIIQQFKPDIIHIFGTENDFGLIVSKTTVPCIIHLQGNLIVNNLKWYSGLTVVDVLKYSKKWLLVKGHGLYHDYYVNKKAAERENKIFRSCRYFMGRTDWDRRLSAVLSPDSKYFLCDEIMRPGFYIQKWQPQSNQTTYTITSTIRNNIYKGLDTIFESKKILSQNFPEFEIIWKIVGIKETDEISYLVERKFKAKFNDYNIQLLGSLNEDDLISEMLKANLFVHSSHIDNSPNSVCEAMLLGMPVIASYAGGTPSLISDKKEGLLVQDGDPYALAGAIIELYKDRNYAISLGTNARERAMIRHNPNRILNDILNIYSSLISKN